MTGPGLADLVARVARFEKMQLLSDTQFDNYLDTVGAIEDVLLDESLALSTNCRFAEANDLLDNVIELNRVLCEIAEREAGRRYGDQSAYGIVDTRHAAEGLILMVEARKLWNLMDGCQLSGDLRGAREHLSAAMRYLDELQGTRHPLAELAQLRIQLGMAQDSTLQALESIRCGNFHGAHDQLDRCRIVLEELQADLNGADTERLDVQSRTLFDEVQRTLAIGIANAIAMQGLTDLLHAMQIGDYVLAADRGRSAVPLYEASVHTALDTGLPRNLVEMRKMELAHLRGWVALAEAERAIDNRDWEACRGHGRSAQAHWAELSRYLLRSVEVGVLPQRPDTGSLEILVRGVLRRCEREEQLLRTINDLQGQLAGALRAGTVVYASGGNTVPPVGDQHFHGPVNVHGILGHQGRIDNNTHVDARGPFGDFRELADQLAALQEAITAGARTHPEKEVVEHVQNAEQSARRGDESGVRRHLAAAGRWALSIAKQLGMAAAAAAIELSIRG